MSAAGTPSTDPWVILAPERARFEEQFRALKPNNGVVTGDQAKGFFLKSQLPPMILGQIWALADTDVDGRMDVNEFLIACKLINLKCRGYEVPKGLPPSLMASLRSNVAPAIPPLPSAAALISAPPRPEPPKPVMAQTQMAQPAVHPVQPVSVGSAAAAPMLVPMGTGMQQQQQQQHPPPLPPPGIPTGIVPPMQSGGVHQMQHQQPLIGLGQPMVSQQVMPPTTGYGVPMSMGHAPPPVMPPMPAMPPVAPSLIQGANMGQAPPVLPPAVGHTIPGQVSAPHMSPLGGAAPPAVPMAPPTAQYGPGATSTPRTSIASLEKAPSVESPLVEWAVPHHSKLKFTQVFNTTDRARSGYLTGVQARNIMVQSKLSQNILAQIWALSDMDSDGRLGCEEFVLAMHLCEQAAMGNPPPTKLPPDLIPPSFRRTTRTASISSQGSLPLDLDPASTLLQTSFEDRRKENFEKGQAELERRRKALLDQQRKEAEERERKEREEIERREKARQEAERKRMEELERQMREQQEHERLKEEERKRQADQREAARREMERQRQLEWEKQRLQELQQQRQREQENVLKLKAKNQTLTIDLSSLNEQVRELSQKICDTRLGVSNVKTTIDGMRSTRDTQMQEMSQLKNKLKEQNTRLLSLSQEKVKLEAKNKLNAQMSGNPDSEQAKIAFDSKEVSIKNLREKIADMQQEIEGKLSDIENNNTQLVDLKTQMASLVNECENLYGVYEGKRNKVLEMKNSNKATDYGSAWKTTDSWGDGGVDNKGAEEWPDPESSWPTSSVPAAAPSAANDVTASVVPGVVRYRALYEFVARNTDEVSFQPGDIINVPLKQTGEPGWLAGEIRGHTGWFPESYVEPVDGVNVRDTAFEEELETQRLEGIAEVPEAFEPAAAITTTTNSTTTIPTAAEVSSPVTQQAPEDSGGDVEYYISNYPYQSQEQGDLTFNAGEVITVIKKDGDWWTGKIGATVGIFPSNYVQKVDVNSSTNSYNATATTTTATTTITTTTTTTAATTTTTAIANIPTESDSPITTSAPPSTAAPATPIAAFASATAAIAESANLVDNEVSQINENKSIDRASFDASSVSSYTQSMKGKKPEIASVIAPYQATSTEQLSLARGQLIMIRKKTDSGWWEGELQAKGRKRQVGWFPASYVKLLNSSGKTSGRNTPVSTTRMQQEVVIDKVITLFPYTAGNPDELSFGKDEIISVTAREEEAWWRGELNGISGLFPSNYVAPLQQQYHTANFGNKKRHESIREFVQTEKAYVDDMSVVYEVFEGPLRRSGIISKEEVDTIFVNWFDILQCNKRFLSDLYEWSSSDSDVIGNIISENLRDMKVYETFCGKQLDSAALLQKLTETSTAFRDLVKRCQNNIQTKGMPLSSFLIKPMQRITRYPLLISKIIENTPHDHPDIPPLHDALRSAEKFLNDINENVRQKENQERYDWLQRCVQNELNIVFDSETNKLGHRKLIHFGALTKVKSGKELIGFLFNDFFLLVQPSKSLGTQFAFQRNNNITYKVYKSPILLQDLSISRESTEHVEQGTDSNRVLKLQDNKSKNTLSLLAPTVNECNLWMKRMESAKEVYSKVDFLTHTRPKTMHYDGIWLYMTVVKGTEIAYRNNPLKRKGGKPHSDNVYCKVSLGDQKQQTPLAKELIVNGNVPQTGAPQVPSLVWNHSMQFQLRNIETESVSFVVYGFNPYAPDEFLGRADLKVYDIMRESQHTKGPILKKLILHQVESGEISVKLDLHMFDY